MVVVSNDPIQVWLPNIIDVRVQSYISGSWGETVSLEFWQWSRSCILHCGAIRLEWARQCLLGGLLTSLPYLQCWHLDKRWADMHNHWCRLSSHRQLFYSLNWYGWAESHIISKGPQDNASHSGRGNAGPSWPSYTSLCVAFGLRVHWLQNVLGALHWNTIQCVCSPDKGVANVLIRHLSSSVRKCSVSFLTYTGHFLWPAPCRISPLSFFNRCGKYFVSIHAIRVKFSCVPT
jgi:hypothetical protein